MQRLLLCIFSFGKLAGRLCFGRFCRYNERKADLRFFRARRTVFIPRQIAAETGGKQS